MLNVKDLEEYTAKINAAIDDSGVDSDEAIDLIAEYTGPENWSLVECWRQKALHCKGLV